MKLIYREKNIYITKLFSIAKIAAFVFATASSHWAVAGELKILVPTSDYDQEVHGPCTGRFSGVIERGDIARVDKAIDFSPNARLCLEGTGGSLPVAAELQSDWATRVTPGKACESACAIWFMRGGNTQGNGIPAFYSDRAIWAGARVGFHSPNIKIKEVPRITLGMVEGAYQTALESLSIIYQLRNKQDASGKNFVNDYVYQRILDTSPDSMYYIDTVGDAIEADIAVLGVRYRQKLTTGFIRTLCNNAMILNNEWQSQLHSPDTLTSAKEKAKAFDTEFASFYDDGFASGEKFNFTGFYNLEGDILGYAGMYPSGDYRFFNECYLHISKKHVSNDYFELDAPSSSGAPISGIDIRISSAPRIESLNSNEEILKSWKNISRNGSSLVLPSLALFRFDTSLSELPKTAQYTSLFPPH